MVVNIKVELIVAVHVDDIAIAGSDGMQRFPCPVIYKIPREQPRRTDWEYWLRFETRLGTGGIIY